MAIVTLSMLTRFALDPVSVTVLSPAGSAAEYVYTAHIWSSLLVVGNAKATGDPLFTVAVRARVVPVAPPLFAA
jgi:hypothetical protein